MPSFLASLSIEDETIQEAFLDRAVRLLVEDRLGVLQTRDASCNSGSSGSADVTAFWSGVLSGGATAPGQLPPDPVDGPRGLTGSSEQRACGKAGVAPLVELDSSRQDLIDRRRHHEPNRKNKAVPTSDLERFVSGLEDFHVQFKGPQHAGRRFVEKLSAVLPTLSTRTLCHVLEAVRHVPGADVTTPFLEEMHRRLVGGADAERCVEGTTSTTPQPLSAKDVSIVIEKLSPVLFETHGSSAHALQWAAGYASHELSGKIQEMKERLAALVVEDINKAKNMQALVRPAGKLRYYTDPCFCEEEDGAGDDGEDHAGVNKQSPVLKALILKAQVFVKSPNDFYDLLYYVRHLDAEARCALVEAWFLPYYRKSRDMGLDALTVCRWLEMLTGLDKEMIADVQDIRCRLAERVLGKGGIGGFCSVHLK